MALNFRSFVEYTVTTSLILLPRQFWSRLEVCISSSSSSSCLAISTDIAFPLSPPLTIAHFFQQLFRGTPHICTDLQYVGSCWSSCLLFSIWRAPQEYITYELVPNSSAVSPMSSSSNFDGFRDGWSVGIQLLLCGMLPPGLVQYCLQHSCVVTVKLFLHTFS